MLENDILPQARIWNCLLELNRVNTRLDMRFRLGIVMDALLLLCFLGRKLLSWIPHLAIMICARFDSLLIFHIYFASATGHLDSVDSKTFNESLPSVNLPVQRVSKEFHIGPDMNVSCYIKGAQKCHHSIYL